MKTTDIRDENFTHLCATLDDRRATVLRYLAVYGPCTTRHLAQLSTLDILSVRPRVTELVQMGLVELRERVRGEGVYAVRSQREWEQWQAQKLEETTTGQLQLV